MTTAAHTAPLAAPAAPGLGHRVLGHLDAQIESARRLLSAVLTQGAAIRARKVDEVIACMAAIKAEMELRAHLEEDRTSLLVQAGSHLGVAPAGVTLEGMATLMAPAEADDARSRSAELRGLLGEIAREHGINRALMRQELAFLDHLVRMLGREPEAGYRRGGSSEGGQSRDESAPYRVLDLQA